MVHLIRNLNRVFVYYKYSVGKIFNFNIKFILELSIEVFSVHIYHVKMFHCIYNFNRIFIYYNYVIRRNFQIKKYSYWSYHCQFSCNNRPSSLFSRMHIGEKQVHCCSSISSSSFYQCHVVNSCIITAGNNSVNNHPTNQ